MAYRDTSQGFEFIYATKKKGDTSVAVDKENARRLEELEKFYDSLEGSDELDDEIKPVKRANKISKKRLK